MSEAMDAWRYFREQQDEAYKRLAEAAKEPNPCSALIGFKPIVSNSAGVHPSQVEQARESAKKRGVPTDFDSKGRPIFTSRKHRKDYCEKVRGLHDMDGSYGDPHSNGPLD